MYAVNPDDLLDQGDIIRHVWTARKTPVSPDEPVEGHRTAVIVLSHGCEIDKPISIAKRTDTLLVACVLPFSVVDRNLQRFIRSSAVINAYFLPKEDCLPEDCFIDWRTVQPVDKQTLLDARRNDAYVCTVTGDLLAAMGEHYWGFLFRSQQRNNTQLPPA